MNTFQNLSEQFLKRIKKDYYSLRNHGKLSSASMAKCCTDNNLDLNDERIFDIFRKFESSYTKAASKKERRKKRKESEGGSSAVAPPTSSPPRSRSPSPRLRSPVPRSRIPSLPRLRVAPLSGLQSQASSPMPVQATESAEFIELPSNFFDVFRNDCCVCFLPLAGFYQGACGCKYCLPCAVGLMQKEDCNCKCGKAFHQNDVAAVKKQ